MKNLTNMVRPEVEGVVETYRRALESSTKVKESIADLSDACYHTGFGTLSTMGAIFASNNINDSKTAGLLAGFYLATAGIEFARAGYHYFRAISD